MSVVGSVIDQIDDIVKAIVVTLETWQSGATVQRLQQLPAMRQTLVALVTMPLPSDNIDHSLF